MNLKIALTSLFIMTCVGGPSLAHADREGRFGGGRGEDRREADYRIGNRYDDILRAADEARRLDGMTRNGTKYPQVRDAVSRYSMMIDQLARCERQYGGNQPPMPRPGEDRYRYRYCDRELYDVMNSHGMVIYYLYDSQRDAPRVYEQFRRVYDAVHAYLFNGERIGGGGNYPPVQVVSAGQMDGYSYTFSARDTNDMKTQCREFAARNYIRLIGCLDVNGARFGRCADAYARSLDVEEACELVARHAR